MAESKFKFTLDTRNWERAVRRFPDLLWTHIEPGMGQAARKIKDDMIVNRLSGPHPKFLHPRTGALRGSLYDIVFGSNIATGGFHVGFDKGRAPHAKHHEPPPAVSEISPKKAGGYLAIPIFDALTPVGVRQTEYDPGPGGSLRSIPNLFPVKRSEAKGGGLFLCKRVGKETKFLFVLKKTVKVKRRMGFMDLFKKYMGKNGKAMKLLKINFRKAVKTFNDRKKK